MHEGTEIGPAASRADPHGGHGKDAARLDPAMIPAVARLESVSHGIGG
jgi:hypothetical protein